MHMKDRELWQRISQFRVDDDSSELRFVDRLARDNGWARAYAEDVYEEYLKFVYLMALGEGIRTPSDAVDQAWHLHLSYSQSYWDDLCKGTLHAPLHHGPTRGGNEEAQKYRDAYARTLQAYEREFGHPPMPRIWPPTGQRFSHVDRFQRVNTANRFVIGKKRLVVAIAALIGLTVAATANADAAFLRGALGTLLIVVGIPVVALVLLWVFNRLGIRGGGGGAGGSCGGGAGCGGCSGCGGCGG